ncbi:MAG: CidA/LrgA family protein [Eubacteriales bacterium]
MKYLKQFGIILAVSFVGELFNRLLPLPVPASIYGIVLLFLLLVTGVLPLGAVREAGSFLIAIMPVMFIPAAVGLIEQLGRNPQLSRRLSHCNGGFDGSRDGGFRTGDASRHPPRQKKKRAV